MKLSRRNFFNLTAASAGSIVLASSLEKFYQRIARGESIESRGFGQLQRDPQNIIDLPPGFKYSWFSATGEVMSDGTRVPPGHDGMATFKGNNGETILIRNHELSPENKLGVVANNSNKYDVVSKGGTTTIIIDKNRRLKQHFVSLAGTNRNCAGGKTMRGSWISCEEDVSTPDTAKVSKKHGYNFEVEIDKPSYSAIPLVAMGRFKHEAISQDPETGYIYQTEDQVDSCFYRFRPTNPNNLAQGGILEALTIPEIPKVNTSINFPQGKPQSVAWVEIEQVDPNEDTVRYEAQSKGAAIFRRGEGTCWGNGDVYWTCTSGGKAGVGQVFRYTPASNTIELYLESPGQQVLDYPDNLTFTPYGHLLVCEDGQDEQFLVGITPQGRCYPLARNAYNNSEFAGVCFSPDGQTLFVNIQNPGVTLAIWGPWLNFSN